MTENFEIIGSFVKDMSSETPDVPTYIFVREKISQYQLNIDINSRAVKEGILEVNIIMKFTDKLEVLKKSHFEINYTTIVKVDKKVTDKKVVNISDKSTSFESLNSLISLSKLFLIAISSIITRLLNFLKIRLFQSISVANFLFINKKLRFWASK